MKVHSERLNNFIILFLTVALAIINFNGASRAIYDRTTHKLNYASELSTRNHLKKLTNSIHVMDYGNQSKKRKFEVFDQAKKIDYQVVLNNTDITLQSKFVFQDTYAKGIIFNNTGQEQIVELPFYRYKGQIVTVDGQKVPTILSASGSTTIHLPTGQHQVKIAYRYTPVARVAFAASLMSLLMVTTYNMTYNLIEKYDVDIYFNKKNGLVIYRKSLKN